jgi:rubrerythrin
MFFSEVEAVKIAQNMEDLGLSFYRKAADKAWSPQVKKVFHQLAQQELAHLERFQELARVLQAQPQGHAGPVRDFESDPYFKPLQEMASFRAGGDVDRLAAAAVSDCDALAVGMQAERDAILFYMEVIGAVESSLARAAFSTILEEERQHLQRLGDLKKTCERRTP